MQHYHQLSIEEREKIQQGLWEQRSVREIARRLGRVPSTISREINRNVPPTMRRYAPRLAHVRAQATIRQRGQRPRLKSEDIRQYVIQGLRDDLSPEQVAGRMRREHPPWHVSPEAVYQFVYAQYHRGGYGTCHGLNLRPYLARAHKARRRKHTLFPVPKGSITGRISITERPAEVAQRQVIGHWEGDSMVSRQSVAGLNTLVERVSGLLLLSRLKDSTAAETARVVVQRLTVVPQKLRTTCTLDNGHENANHQAIAAALRMRVYFAHPYHSWERGTNENTNGLVRRYLPKGTDFALVTNAELQRIEAKLNNRPRKRLGYQTPLEVFTQSVALECGM